MGFANHNKANLSDLISRTLSSRSPTTFGSLCRLCILEAGMFTPISMAFGEIEPWTLELVIVFRDAIDEYIALYKGHAEVTMALSRLFARRPEDIPFLLTRLIAPESHSKRLTLQDGRQIAIPAWRGTGHRVREAELYALRWSVVRYALATLPAWRSAAGP